MKAVKSCPDVRDAEFSLKHLNVYALKTGKTTPNPHKTAPSLSGITVYLFSLPECCGRQREKGAVRTQTGITTVTGERRSLESRHRARGRQPASSAWERACAS